MKHKVRKCKQDVEPTLEWWLEEECDGEIALMAGDADGYFAVARITPDGRLRIVACVPTDKGLQHGARGGIFTYGAV